MSASEPRLVPVHALCGRTCSEERAATHPTLYGAAGAARAPHAVPGARLRGHARAAGTSPSCARCWRAAGVWSRLAEALLWASSSSRHSPAPWLAAAALNPPRGEAGWLTGEVRMSSAMNELRASWQVVSVA